MFCVTSGFCCNNDRSNMGTQLFLLIVLMLLNTILFKLSGKFTQRELDAYAAASAIAEEVLSAIRTVVAFDGKKVESARYGEHLIYAKQSNIRKALFTSINNGIMWFFVYACYSLSFWYGIGLYLKERNLPEYERVYTSGNIVAVRE